MTGWTQEATEVTTDDFETLQVLGKGSFGKVMLVKKKDDGKLYALKVLRKAAIIERNQVCLFVCIHHVHCNNVCALNFALVPSG